MQNTSIYGFNLVFLIILFAACTSRKDKAGTSNINDGDPLAKMKIGANDTSIYLHCHGKSKKFMFDKQFVDTVLRMQKMADIYENKSLDSTLIVYKDVTNDGISDKLVSRLFFSPDTFYVGRFIFQKDSIIYKDTIAEKLKKREQIASKMNNDFEAISDFLYPYSLYLDDLAYYLDLTKYNRDFNLPKYADNPNAYFFKQKREELEKLRLPKKIIDEKIEMYKTYIRNYKGNIISQPRHTEEGEFPVIWYAPEKKFIYLE